MRALSLVRLFAPHMALVVGELRRTYGLSWGRIDTEVPTFQELAALLAALPPDSPLMRQVAADAERAQRRAVTVREATRPAPVETPDQFRRRMKALMRRGEFEEVTT